MFDPSSFVNPTPLAHADASRDVLSRGGTSQSNLKNLILHKTSYIRHEQFDSKDFCLRIVSECTNRVKFPFPGSRSFTSLSSQMKNSGLCIRKKRSTAWLTLEMLPKRLQARFFFKTDESHLVREQDYMADGVGALNQELQYGFALPSPSEYRIVIQQQLPDLRSLGRFFRIAPFNCDRVSQYHVAL
ncbi:hypothetical protein TNCV_4737251 [Trichonephila clavipes]|nr:hypothetical protein TNCV_4737251 [Trichonephila clavipes]